MRDNFIYENHQGRTFSGLENGVYLNYSDLRNYDWKYDTINDKISRFYRPITTRKIPLQLRGKTDTQATAVKNQLLELTDTDIIARKPGKIYIGEYYTNGYITSSRKSNYLLTKQYAQIDLQIVSDDPAWYREQHHSFLPGSDDDVALAGGTDYPYDYPYDYPLALKGQKIICESVDSNPFRLIIYGPIENPTLSIGDNIYRINGNVAAGEVLTIDSLSKTITLTLANGQKMNWFSKRDRNNYIFASIPSGQNSVSWSGKFGFDLTVIEKRSEPKWI